MIHESGKQRSVLLSAANAQNIDFDPNIDAVCRIYEHSPATLTILWVWQNLDSSEQNKVLENFGDKAIFVPG